MSTEELQKRTTVNIQEKANLIWAIADFLDRKCAEIDELIAIKQQKIEMLKKYKKSIIFEYVLGNKEVEE